MRFTRQNMHKNMCNRNHRSYVPAGGALHRRHDDLTDPTYLFFLKPVFFLAAQGLVELQLICAYRVADVCEPPGFDSGGAGTGKRPPPLEGVSFLF